MKNPLYFSIGFYKYQSFIKQIKWIYEKKNSWHYFADGTLGGMVKECSNCLTLVLSKLPTFPHDTEKWGSGRMWRTACLYLLGTVCFLGSLKQEVLGPEAVRLPSELCLILLWRTWLLPIAHSLNPSSQQLAAPSELRPVECLRAQSLHVCQCSADCLQLCKLTWLSGEEQAFASLPSYLNSNQVTCSLSQLFSFCWAPDLAEALREVTFSQHCSCSTR